MDEVSTFEKKVNFIYYLIDRHEVIVEYHKDGPSEFWGLYEVSSKNPQKQDTESCILSKHHFAEGYRHAFFVPTTKVEAALDDEDYVSDRYAKRVIRGIDRLMETLTIMAQEHKAQNIKTYQELQYYAAQALASANLQKVKENNNLGK